MVERLNSFVSEVTRVAREVGTRARLGRHPLVARTAHMLAGDEAKALAACCAGYLTKPIDARAFAGQVARFIGPPPPSESRSGLSACETRRAGSILRTMRYSVFLEPVREPEFRGYYYAHVPALDLTTHGQGIEGAVAAARELLEGWIAERRAHGEAVPVEFRLL